MSCPPILLASFVASLKFGMVYFCEVIIIPFNKPTIERLAVWQGQQLLWLMTNQVLR